MRYALTVMAMACLVSGPVKASESAGNLGDILGPTDICLRQVYNFGVAPIPNATYQWTAINGQILNGQGTNLVNVRWNDMGTNGLSIVILLPNLTLYDTLLVNSHLKPYFNLGPDGAFCQQGLVLSPGQGYQSYLWQNGGTIDSLPVNGPGVYWCQVTDQFGCHATDTVVVTPNVPTPFIYPSGTTEICEGNSTMLFGPNGFASYYWNGMNMGQVVTVSNSLNLTLTVIDSLGCYASSPVASVVMHEVTTPVVNLNHDTLWASPYVNIPNTIFTWTKNGNLVGNNICWHVPDTSAYYKVSIRDSNNCEATSEALFASAAVGLAPQATYGLTAFPNPNNGLFALNLPAGLEADATVGVYNQLGQKVKEVSLGAVQDHADMDLRSLPMGQYHLVLESTTATYHARIVISH